MDKKAENINLLEAYLNNPGRFSILIFGERGTGKTKWIKHFIEKMNIHEENFIHVSCASFTDDISAEVELFGVKKGIYTNVFERDGVFKKAQNGLIFFDEIHTLSKRVKEKLMLSLQTEPEGKHKGEFSYYIVGDAKKNYSNARVVFATNKSVAELKIYLLPDFYDRIAQLIVEMPSISEINQNLKEIFHATWHYMKFENKNEMPNLSEFYKWLKIIALPGNFRDLEKIAILWHQCRLMNFQSEEDIFDWVKKQFTKYHSNTTITEHQKYNFQKGKSKKEMEKDFRNAMYNWALEVFENNKEAEKSLNISRMDILKK